ncbi:MAG: carboxymuconolactone decarboxylase family protein [Pseudomonadota bacterium]
MTQFAPHTIDSAPTQSKPILEGMQKALGFVPNLYGIFAESPSLLEAYSTLSGLMEKSAFSATEAQIVLMTNNRLNGCDYCMAAHTVISEGAGIDSDIIEALRDGSALEDAKLEALRQFAIVVNESRGWPTEAQLQAFYAAGYTAQSVLNVILATALKVLSNYTNHIAKTPLDAAFQPAAWSPEEARQAA